jgi:hypothetical protein
MSELQLVKKITTKIIVGKKLAKLEEKTRLYSIIGIVSGLKSGESNYGAWTALIGRFEARRESDGQIFSATMALLPEVAGDPVISAVRSSQGDDIEFGLIISAEPTLSAPGYVYDIQTVIPAGRHDALSNLRSLMHPFHVEQ